ncbi:MAG: winged helix-turn-helix domain-containing protein, partial [Mycobacterium sp.]
MLLALVRRSREVVAKDELMRMVWPDTVVEDANLSQSIFMLRKALGDTSGTRHYIVTLPGRGYRFAEPVRVITEDDADGDGSRLPPPGAPGSDPRMVSSYRGRWKHVLVSGAVLIALSIGATTLLHMHRPAALATVDPVLVADFVNSTGDPAFDETLRQGLA